LSPLLNVQIIVPGDSQWREGFSSCIYVHHTLRDQTTYIHLQAYLIEHTLTHVRNQPS
jgi:hypothetical protein